MIKVKKMEKKVKIRKKFLVLDVLLIQLNQVVLRLKP